MADLLAWLGAGVALASALRGIDWTRLADRESALVYAAVVAVLVALRLAALSLRAGEELHFAGAAIATLMFGWRYALLALAIATAADVALSGAAWIGAPWEFLCGAVLPVAVTWWLLAATRQWLPRNPFAYFLGAAFGGGAASVLAIRDGQGRRAAGPGYRRWRQPGHPLPPDPAGDDVRRGLPHRWCADRAGKPAAALGGHLRR